MLYRYFPLHVPLYCLYCTFLSFHHCPCLCTIRDRRNCYSYKICIWLLIRILLPYTISALISKIYPTLLNSFLYFFFSSFFKTQQLPQIYRLIHFLDCFFPYSYVFLLPPPGISFFWKLTFNPSFLPSVINSFIMFSNSSMSFANTTSQGYYKE